MYIYRIGYYSFEESPQRYLTHDVKFEADEFRQLVLLAVEAAARKWLAAPIEDVSWFNQYDCLVPTDIADWLIQERGFRDVELTASENFSGWSSIFPEHDGRFRSDEEINKAATARLIELGLEDQILARNREIEDRLDRYYHAHNDE